MFNFVNLCRSLHFVRCNEVLVAKCRTRIRAATGKSAHSFRRRLVTACAGQSGEQRHGGRLSAAPARVRIRGRPRHSDTALQPAACASSRVFMCQLFSTWYNQDVLSSHLLHISDIYIALHFTLCRPTHTLCAQNMYRNGDEQRKAQRVATYQTANGKPSLHRTRSSSVGAVCVGM